MAEKEARLIDANALAKIYMLKGKDKLRLPTVINELEMMPTIDPESLRAHGKWVHIGEGSSVIRCPFCSFVELTYRTYNYCPKCGAKMEGGITMSNYCKTCIYNEVCSLTHCDQSIACCDFVSGWISVKDRLPDDSDKIVLVIANGKFGNTTLNEAFELACYYKDYGWVLESYPDMENVRVTHWMPLPEPPKED